MILIATNHHCLDSLFHSVQFSSVAQSCPALCNPVDCSTPGLPVHQQLLEMTQTHVHWSRWCHPTISSSVVPFSSCLQSFPTSRFFQMSQLFASGGQSIGVWASASVFPMNIQDWSPLGGTGWISLQPKGLWRVWDVINYVLAIGVNQHCSNHPETYVFFIYIINRTTM